MSTHHGDRELQNPQDVAGPEWGTNGFPPAFTQEAIDLARAALADPEGHPRLYLAIKNAEREMLQVLADLADH